MSETIVIESPDELIVNQLVTSVIVLTAGEQGPPGPSFDGTMINKLSMPAQGALSGHRVMRGTGDGHVQYASSADVLDAPVVLGISTGAAADGAPISVQYAGEMIEPSWSWTPGLPIFCGVGGVLTQVNPSTGFSLVVGVASTPTVIVVGIKQPIVVN